MKRNLLLVFVGLVVVFVGGLCLRYYLPDLKGPHLPVEPESDTQSGMVVMQNADDFLLSAGQTVLSYLSQGNVFALQEVISSEGVTFLPYPNNGLLENGLLEKSQTFLSEEMSGGDFLALSGSFVWGEWDGSGEEIVLSAQEYYNRFIWDYNYLEAPEVLVGDEVVSRGNTLVNLGELFSGARVIEYHFSGFDSQYDGIDWKSLYLVFVEEEGGLFLRAIAHGEWTI